MVSAALVLFMTVGLAFFYGGLEPRRNVLQTVAMNLFTIAIVTWIAAGFSLAFGPDAGHGLIGNLHYAGLANMSGLWPGTHIPKLAFMAFQMMFAITTPALITGALAGRLKFKAWIAICAGWSLIIYPVIATGCLTRLAGFTGSAAATSPEVPSCTSSPASRRQCSSSSCAPGAHRTPRPTSPRRFPSSCLPRASCGSPGSASTPAKPSARTSSQPTPSP